MVKEQRGACATHDQAFLKSPLAKQEAEGHDHERKTQVVTSECQATDEESSCPRVSKI